MDSDAQEIGRRVREEREKAGLSHAQLAEAAGLTKSYVVRLEMSGGNPTVAALGAIADALDLTIADLLRKPKITLAADVLENVPNALRAYADDNNLNSAEVRMLASIRWRQGEQPHTVERWRFVHDSLRASRSLEPELEDVNDD